MTLLPPPPPPPPPAGHAPPAPKKKSRKVRTLVILVSAFVVVAALAFAAIIWMPTLRAAIAGSGVATPSPIAVAGTATADASPTPTASSSPTPSPTIQMAKEWTPPPSPVPTDSPVPSPSGASLSSYDLGLGTPVTSMPCNGQYVTFYYSAKQPSTYATDISNALSKYPGTSYLTTQGACSALNQVSDLGTRIYAVYSGPYDNLAEACQGVAVHPEAYVKQMVSSSDPESSRRTCG